MMTYTRRERWAVPGAVVLMCLATAAAACRLVLFMLQPWP